MSLVKRSKRPFWHWLIYLFSALLLLLAASLIAYVVFMVAPWNWGNEQKLEEKGTSIVSFSTTETGVANIMEYAENLGLICGVIDEVIVCSATKPVPGSYTSIYVLIVSAEAYDGEIVSPMVYQIDKAH